VVWRLGFFDQLGHFDGVFALRTVVSVRCRLFLARFQADWFTAFKLVGAATVWLGCAGDSKLRSKTVGMTFKDVSTTKTLNRLGAVFRQGAFVECTGIRNDYFSFGIFATVY